MKKNAKKTLQNQVAALEALAGLTELTTDEASRKNGGLAARRIKPLRGSGGVAVRIGSGAVAVRRGTGALVVRRGSGAVAVRVGLGG